MRGLIQLLLLVSLAAGGTKRVTATETGHRQPLCVPLARGELAASLPGNKHPRRQRWLGCPAAWDTDAPGYLALGGLQGWGLGLFVLWGQGTGFRQG